MYNSTMAYSTVEGRKDKEKQKRGTAMRQLLMEILEELRKQNQYTRAMNRTEAAEYLGIHPDTLWRLARENRISYSRLGDGERAPLRFRKKDLDEYLDACRIPAVAA